MANRRRSTSQILDQALVAGLRYHPVVAARAAMSKVPTARLLALRDELHRRGQRRSMVFPSAAPTVIEAVTVVEEYGALCEAMFLVMAVEKRMLNAQRELLRGALDVLSNGRVRSSHMEAMLDAASKRLAEDGIELRRQRVIAALRDDPVRAETMLVLAGAIAAADGKVSDREQELLDHFVEGLGVGQDRLSEILRELTAPQPTAAKS
jgi:tellurite resistance protein